jgi:hypothetical protein
MPFIVIGIYYPVRPLLRKVAALRHAKQAKAEQARLDAQFE